MLQTMAPSRDRLGIARSSVQTILGARPGCKMRPGSEISTQVQPSGVYNPTAATACVRDGLSAMGSRPRRSVGGPAHSRLFTLAS